MGDATHHGTIERQVSVRCEVGENVVDSEERIGDETYLVQVARNDCDGVAYFAVHVTAADGDPIHVSCVAVRESDRRFVVVPEGARLEMRWRSVLDGSHHARRRLLTNTQRMKMMTLKCSFWKHWHRASQTMARSCCAYMLSTVKVRAHGAAPRMER